ncbi:MAG: PspC domain-containing protein [Actinomycetota bacterium]
MSNQQVGRLTRRTDNKIIGGVASGLGDYFGVDPVWFRLGFGVTTLMGGVGIFAYIVLWLVMPEYAGPAASPAERGLERVARAVRSTPTWIGVALVILGGILALDAAVDWRPGVIWGLTFIVFGVLLFVKRADRPALESPPSPAVATAREVAPPPPPRARERSTLGFMTFGGLLVSLGVVILLDMQDVIGLTVGQYLALALGVIGIGLLVGSVIGRARWLIVPGMLLIPFVLAASLIHVPFEGGFGQRTYRPTGIPAFVTEYHLIAGEMTIDLRGLTPSSPYKIEATTVAGRILILVPEGVPLDIEAKAGAGQVNLFGQLDEGVNVDVHRTFHLATAPTPGTATIEIDAETGLGQVEVRS